MDKKEEILNYLLETLKDTVQSTKEQAPEVVAEILKYDAWQAYFKLYPLALGLLFSGLSALVFYKLAVAHCAKEDDPDETAFGLSFIVSIIIFFCLLVVSPFAATKSYFTIKQIEMSPKYYLIEKIRKDL